MLKTCTVSSGNIGNKNITWLRWRPIHVYMVAHYLLFIVISIIILIGLHETAEDHDLDKHDGLLQIPPSCEVLFLIVIFFYIKYINPGIQNKSDK